MQAWTEVANAKDTQETDGESELQFWGRKAGAEKVAQSLKAGPNGRFRLADHALSSEEDLFSENQKGQHWISFESEGATEKEPPQDTEDSSPRAGMWNTGFNQSLHHR